MPTSSGPAFLLQSLQNIFFAKTKDLASIWVDHPLVPVAISTSRSVD
jgi:hypothetical protein